MTRTLPLLLALAACTPEAPTGTPPGGPPPAPPSALATLVGEYSDGTDTLSILERDGQAWILRWGSAPEPLTTQSDSTFGLIGGDGVLQSTRDEGGVASLELAGSVFARIELGGREGESFRITPVRAPEELRDVALGAQPPEEEGTFRESDLVELVTLDPTIRLDVRYATNDNFMGEVFYSEARAFLQRPAAEALVRAHRALSDRGYGLLIHDGYRPWYVTRMFWDATPEPLKIFVADPLLGSRHNRGCAVDLTLFDLATGTPIEMTGGYDEMSARSFPDYPGGTTRQRWHRELLRQAMEAQGFQVYDAEWWHFDYQDWRSYRIGNQRFEEIEAAATGVSAGR